MFFFYNSRKAPSLYFTVSKLHKNDPFHLIEGSSSSKDDVGVVHLYGPLSKPHQIGSNTYGSACDLEDKTSARLPISNHPAFHIFTYSKSFFLTEHTNSRQSSRLHILMCVCTQVRSWILPDSSWWSPHKPERILQQSFPTLSNSPHPALHLYL